MEFVKLTLLLGVVLALAINAQAFECHTCFYEEYVVDGKESTPTGEEYCLDGEETQDEDKTSGCLTSCFKSETKTKWEENGVETLVTRTERGCFPEKRGDDCADNYEPDVEAIESALKVYDTFVEVVGITGCTCNTEKCNHGNNLSASILMLIVMVLAAWKM